MAGEQSVGSSSHQGMKGKKTRASKTSRHANARTFRKVQAYEDRRGEQVDCQPHVLDTGCKELLFQDERRDIRREKEERIREGQRGPPEGTDSLVATDKKPFAEPTPNHGPHAPGLVVEERDPPPRIGRIGPDSVRRDGWGDQDRIK